MDAPSGNDARLGCGPCFLKDALAMRASPELSWLPAVQADWFEALDALPAHDDEQARCWWQLVKLANHDLDGLQTLRLDRRLQRLFGAAPPEALGSVPVRLAVLASATIEHLLPGLRVAGLRRGLWLTSYVCGYGQYAQELLDPSSGLHRFKPSAVLFALDAPHLLGGLDVAHTAEDVSEKLNAVLARLAQNWRLARDAFGCAVLQQTLLPLAVDLIGNNEHRLPAAPATLVASLNAMIRGRADRDNADIVAIDAQSARDGLQAWHDPVLWLRAKQAIHPAAAPLYGDLVARLLAAQQGRAAKCLVLDLDNTLWGGVVGDDGLDGIVLGQGSALGEAFLAFQHYARNLSRRGVLLAICSKNDEVNALEPFERHPEMVLRRTDIACFIANWDDKAANLRRIAETLNIGLDSLVFADDNPFERNIIRRELPMVAVPELPPDPALYASCIAAAGYFEAVRLTEEDSARTARYQQRARHESLLGATTDLAGYLRSLDMELSWRRFDALGLARIVQLSNKTNQFNLTTRRTTEAEVAALIDDPAALTLQLRLRDQHGDSGMIALVAGRLRAPGGDLLIETWLMSCRVLGREVEQATLFLVAAEARRLGAARLLGEYRPTAKNGMVREHYARLGFSRLDEAPGGATHWALSLDRPVAGPDFIRITEG
jgi:FkbH-like protein